MNQIFLTLTEKQILALTIYGEAMGEPEEGKIAVGSVVLERVKRGNRGKTVRTVCLWRKQFSCFNESEKVYGKVLHAAETWDQTISVDFVLMDCFGLAVGLIDGYLPEHPVILEKKCLNYLNPKWATDAKAKWLAAGMKVVLRVGQHEFFV